MQSAANPKSETSWEKRKRLLQNEELKVKLSDDRAVLQLINPETGLMNTLKDFHDYETDPDTKKLSAYDLKQNHRTILYVNNNKAANTVGGKFAEEALIRGYETLDPTKDQLVNVNNSHSSTQMSALHAMAHYAFSYHKPVKLRAEDVHLLIVQGLANFVMQYPEDFRPILVDYDNKRLLQVDVPDLQSKELWEKMPQGFTQLIKALINRPNVADLILQDYSHTTDIDRTIKAITLMGTFSAYMNYEAGSYCHIPEFILEGTIEDWRKMTELSGKLITELGLSDVIGGEPENGIHLLHRWLMRLHDNMLNKLYQARIGNETDKVFWSSFYKHLTGSNGNAVTGNIVYFYPFLNVKEIDEKRHQVEVKKLNPWIMNLAGIELGKSEHHGPKSGEMPANMIDVQFMAVERDHRYPAMLSGGLIAAKRDHLDGSVKMVPEFSIFYTKTGHPSVPKPSAPAAIASARSAAPPVAANSNNQQAVAPLEKKAVQEEVKGKITFSF
jgi:hypothetical protein